jgi:hypothetical protein
MFAPVLSRLKVEGVSWPAVLPLVVGMLFLESWLFMLGVGVVHAEWLSGLPTIGYWASVKIWVFALPLMFLTTLWSSRPSPRREDPDAPRRSPTPRTRWRVSLVFNLWCWSGGPA